MKVQSVMQWCGGAAVAVSALAIVGCGAAPKAPPATGQTQSAHDPSYPAGPYGYETNSVIADFKILARPAVATGTVTEEAPSELWLSDVRKTADAIILTASAEWCGPCNAEQPDLVKLYKDYAAAGKKVAVIEALVQSTDGSPADNDTLQRWSSKYNIPFNLALDPTGPSSVLTPYYDINAFPMGMVIKSSTMEIYWQSNGAEVPQMKVNVDAVLDGQ